MKELIIDDAIRQDQKLLKDVEQVTRLLEEEMGPSASEITAEWTIFEKIDERLLKVKISDQMVSKSVVISESSVSRISSFGLRISMIRLWGDFLQARSHHQVEDLKLIVQALEGE